MTPIAIIMCSQAMMKVEKVSDPRFIGAVRHNFENSLYYPSLRLVLSRFKEFPIFLWGGAVREPVLKEIHPEFKIFETSDFDIIIDDSKNKVIFDNHLKDIKSVFLNRYGHPKWKIKKYLEIDIGLFSDANKIRSGEDAKICVETVVAGADLNTSAIAYDIKNQIVYSYGAIEAYKKKEVDINYPEGNDSLTQIIRAVLHADKLGFRLGKKAVQLIKKTYSPELNIEIRRLLIYWQKQMKYDFVISCLEAVKKKRKNRCFS